MITRQMIEEDIAFYRKQKKYYEKIAEEAPTGRIYIKNQRGKDRLYLYDGGRERYIARNTLDEMSEYIDGRAAQLMLDRINENLKLLEIMYVQFDSYNAASMEQIYSTVREETIKTVQMAFPDYDLDKITEFAGQNIYIPQGIPEKVRKWLAEPTEYNPYMPEEKTNRTPSGIYVRSKSELLIATMVESYNGPYKYEEKVRLNNRDVYSDFSFLDKSITRGIKWEHFGMMNNSDYRQKSHAKIKDYLDSGYRLGYDLIVTYDDENGSIDMELVQRLIQTYIYTP